MEVPVVSFLNEITTGMESSDRNDDTDFNFDVIVAREFIYTCPRPAFQPRLFPSAGPKARPLVNCGVRMPKSMFGMLLSMNVV